MDKLLIFALLCYSISNIAIFGSIFKGWRDLWERISPNFFYKLFTCFMCLPFWVGFTLSLVGYFYDINSLSPSYSILSIEIIGLRLFLDACLGSGLGWLIHSIQECLERIGSK